MVKKSNTKYKFCKNVQNARAFFAAFLRQNVPSENKYFISVGKTLFLNMDFAAFSASFLLFEKFDMKKSWIFSSELADMRRFIGKYNGTGQLQPQKAEANLFYMA